MILTNKQIKFAKWNTTAHYLHLLTQDLFFKGNGYIPTSSLREILAALDDQLTGDQLNEMISEIDTDGSGTVDFDEFMEMMTGD